MKLLIGLGNPGLKYANNRHNVGHMLVDFLNENLQIQNPKSQITDKSQISNMKIIKTDCFMNLSGKFVARSLQTTGTKLNDLLIAHDDLDIPLGKFHLQFAAGPRLNNGLESIEKKLASKDFWRIRIGIDNRPQENRMNGEAYVLSDFDEMEKKTLETEIFPGVMEQLILHLKANKSERN